MLKVVKFGGSSLADAVQIKKAKEIILSDSDRRFVVVSAPGKRGPDDDKITDLLYDCQKKASAGEDFREPLIVIRQRFEEIAAGLGLKSLCTSPTDKPTAIALSPEKKEAPASSVGICQNTSLSLEDEFALIENRLHAGASAAYAASRGEYLNGRILAACLGFQFVDPADFIRFRKDGSLNLQLTVRTGYNLLKSVDRAVIPGFYGIYQDAIPEDFVQIRRSPSPTATPDKTKSLPQRICTFSRGGSDITGSIVACAVDADVYENWTDVSGFLVADPRIVDNPAVIETITYSELRELSYMGANVLHEDSIFPLRGKSIPIHIRNTNFPEDKGTRIVESSAKPSGFSITGVAGKKNFCSINIEKDRMNNEIGFVRRVLSAFEDARIPVEHVPTGIDTMTVFVNQDDFIRKEQFIISEIHRLAEPDLMEIESDLALIAVVGRGIRGTRGQTAATLFNALATASVNIHMLDQGSSEINIIVGVENKDFERAIRAIYDAFVNYS